MDTIGTCSHCGKYGARHKLEHFWFCNMEICFRAWDAEITRRYRLIGRERYALSLREAGT